MAHLSFDHSPYLINSLLQAIPERKRVVSKQQTLSQ